MLEPDDPSNSAELRRCADGLSHFVCLVRLKFNEPRRWLRSCNPNDDFVRPTSRPITEPATCIVCAALAVEWGL